MLVKKIGAGGMGDVYEAVEEGLNRPIAIKILRADESNNFDRKSRFQAEARTLAKIHHSNVVSVHSVGEQDGISYIAMEFIKGLPLDRFLLVHPVGLRQLVDLFRQMLDGLEAAHSGGIIHRDLKPQNIMIDEQFNVKLVDFGVAKALSDSGGTNTTAGVVLGTIAYIAPELMRGMPATLQCDIYSMGLVFYYALTGEQPFRGKSNLEVMEQIRAAGLKFSPRTRLFIPEALQSLVLRMASASPTVRYKSVNQIRADLSAISMEHLPAEVVSSFSAKTAIVNPDEILERLSKQNMETGDYRLVANIALNLQIERQVPSDRTVDLSAKNAVRIEQDSLAEALTRFNSIRAKISTASYRSQALRVPVPAKRDWRPVMLLVASVIAAGSYFLFFKRGARLPLTVAPVKIDRRNLPDGTWSKQRERAFRNNIVTSDAVRTWTLQEKTGTTYTWLGSDSSVSTEFHNPFLPLMKRRDNVHKLTEEHSISGDIMSIFPLKSGSEFTYEIRGARKLDAHEKPMSQIYRLTCKVGGKQNTYVNSREYETTKVECATSGRQTDYHDTFYYSEEVASWVLREKTEGPYRVLIEAIEFHFPQSEPVNQRQPAQQ